MERFIIFTTQRSGSTVLTRTLDEHPEIFCAGEIFHEINDIHHAEWHFPSWALSEKNKTLRKFDKVINYPNQRLRAIPHVKKFYAAAEKGEKARGFKLMVSHIRTMPFLWNYLKEEKVKVIVLIRKNIFKTALSRLRKDETRLPHLQGTQIESKSIRIAPEKLLRQLNYLENVNKQLLDYSEGMNRIVLYYEDFDEWNEMLSKVFNFLKVSNLTLQPVLNKLSRKDWREEVKNYQEIEQLMKEHNYTQYF
jgi:LPS sulfotransferase NodH